MPPRTRVVLGVEAADEFRALEPPLHPGCRQERGNVGVGHEALPALLIPVEDPPDPVALARVAEDGCSLRAVLLRFSAASVEKTSMKRSTFSTCVVASSISFSFSLSWSG